MDTAQGLCFPEKGDEKSHGPCVIGGIVDAWTFGLRLTGAGLMETALTCTELTGMGSGFLA